MGEDILSQLMALLGPSEAGAATRPQAQAPAANVTLPPVSGMSSADFNGLPFEQAIRLRQQLLQETAQQQRAQQAQQALDLKAKKAQPQDIQAQLQQILAPQQNAAAVAAPREEAPIFRGVTPGTGTPYFSNYNAPEGYAPEAERQRYVQELQGFQSRQAERQKQEAAAAAKPTASGIDAKELGLHAQLVQGLTKAGYSPTAATETADAAFPNVAKSRQAGKDKALTPEQFSKLYKYNPSTGELEVPQENLSQQEAIRQGYRVLDKTQLDKFHATESLDAPLQDFKAQLDRVRNINPFQLKADQLLSSRGLGALSPLETPGLGVEFQKSLFNVTQLFDQMVAGARGAASPQLTQLRQEALPGILNSPDLRDRLMTSFEKIVDGLKRANKAKALGYDPDPKDMKAINSFEQEVGKINKEAGQISKAQSSAAKITQPKGAPATQKGIPPGRVPMIDPDGNPVTVPAQRVQAKLQAGYKPYGNQ